MGPGMRPGGGPGRRMQGTAKMPPGGMKTAARLLKMVLGTYKWSLLVVALCILVTTATTLTSTLFTRSLIDDYIKIITKLIDTGYAYLAVRRFQTLHHWPSRCSSSLLCCRWAPCAPTSTAA